MEKKCKECKNFSRGNLLTVCEIYGMAVEGNTIVVDCEDFEVIPTIDDEE